MAAAKPTGCAFSMALIAPIVMTAVLARAYSRLTILVSLMISLTERRRFNRSFGGQPVNCFPSCFSIASFETCVL